MKTLLTITILTLTTFGCINKQAPKDEKLFVTETEQKKEELFNQVADFPTIIDTAQFINDLRQTFDLEVYESPIQKENENPFLSAVIGTSKGNGGHELYKISADTLQNVYEGYFDYAVRTYDAHQDNRIYEPNELNLKVKDFNNDGYNDISFNGKIVLIQGQTKNGDWFDSETINGETITYSVKNPFKKIPVEFVFLYDKQTGHFKAKENYTKKYGLYN